MSAIFAWLAGTRVGRHFAIGLAALGAIALLIMQAFLRGRAHEKARQQRAQLDALRTRIKTDDEIARLDRPARRARLDKWMRD